MRGVEPWTAHPCSSLYSGSLLEYEIDPRRFPDGDPGYRKEIEIIYSLSFAKIETFHHV
uniref:Uncharacterized protein n=1 Tax=Candidatus Kentrum sp. TC TaxID=2126339 RepID=A0A450Z8Z6_9GAMM|nr:MAG: hypothetical protein BECKTC1821E_GA0114239_10908 [Candidatus Kentron sp. TC]VFK50266.1 MAG: hypothetical protein BECKTC1821D_GA0114238_10979 [Candidatus Kentron sp. TC]VFK63230.1 MAG: hypothetical protein BECKTC1821F_GA0114240_10899 [Candidatus Kentron sp. TC]